MVNKLPYCYSGASTDAGAEERLLLRGCCATHLLPVDTHVLLRQEHKLTTETQPLPINLYIKQEHLRPHFLVGSPII